MKFTLLLTLAGLAIGFSAQERNTVDPQVRQQIEALNHSSTRLEKKVGNKPSHS